MIPTNWDAYYKKTPGYTSVTRRISEAKLTGIMRNQLGSDPVRICELGGANSCFLSGVSMALNVESYHIVDFNEFGLNLLRARSPKCALTLERSDVLRPYAGSETFDLVYSVGLIEHFEPDGTAKAIASHFARCRAGGVVLITFPTPVLTYRVIRGLAEQAGMWAFTDERPLLFDEVTAECERHGRIVHQSINWWIGLAQGYVVARKNA